MAKKKAINPIILQRMYSMYQQGYQMTTISKETGYSYEIVKARITENNTTRDPVILKVPKQAGKYDHLFNEPVAEGKMYNDYFKK